jgi:tRNA pseudouridine38-40 synthase
LDGIEGIRYKEQISGMARFRFIVEYFGAPFAGWQWQENAPTVQGELERALETALRHTIRVTGAGRTDAGVHAVGQSAHFDFDGEFDPGRLMRSLNALAGPHIQVRSLESCDPEFHARYSALSRRYLYRIALRPVVFLREWSWRPGCALDFDLFQSELNSALGNHDFVNFSVPRNDGKSTQCRLLRTEVVHVGPFLEIRVEADRFLHKMVRALVGACFEVARGAQPAGFVQAILEGRSAEARMWAPPQGLCLEKVTYKDHEI